MSLQFGLGPEEFKMCHLSGFRELLVSAGISRFPHGADRSGVLSPERSYSSD